MKSKILWASVGAGVLGINAIVWLVAPSRPGSSALASGGDDAFKQGAEDRIRKLESQLEAISERLEVAPESLTRGDTHTAAPKQGIAYVSESGKEPENPGHSPITPATPEAASETPGAMLGETVEDQAQVAQRRVMQLENAIVSDDVDTRSGQAAEMAIQGIFANGEWFPTQLVSTECRVTLCKFVVSTKSMQEAQDFTVAFSQRLGWASDSEVRVSAQDSNTGAVELTVFQSRDGQRLPSPNG